ncbi:hypothetical protein [Verrucomicrobium sp. 3C]|uniref:hypothetical protein n=1 Tax=Verrucomicrobium sp. 3C TaxID=1134055 RepID=UPI00036B5C2F|nr:hypothetical protein [Verrucomicrobium sp. 3C]
MRSLVLVDLFAEDRAHEELLAPLIRRIAEEERISVEVKIRSARGGQGRALEELKLYQRSLALGFVHTSPDLLVVAIDGNCVSAARKRQEIEQRTDPSLRDRLVAACPDPHIERWYMADAHSFRCVVGETPNVGQKKCERAFYKKAFVDAIRATGCPSPLSGIEFAADLAKKMDLYRAGQEDGSLKDFIDALRSALRRHKQGGLLPLARQRTDDGPKVADQPL